MPVFFDAETSGLFDDADDDSSGPTAPDLYCVCAYDSESKATKRFYERAGGPMQPQTVEKAAQYLLGCSQRVVGFNSAAYDLRLLAHHCLAPELKQRLAELAFEHTDVLLSFWSRTGYPSSLQSFATGMGCGSKLMEGQNAITAWQNNELETVLEYCDSDCKILSDVYDYITTNGRFARVSKAGKLQTTVVDGYCLENVLGALENLDALDVSWMTTPLKPNIDWAFEQFGVDI